MSKDRSFYFQFGEFDGVNMVCVTDADLYDTEGVMDDESGADDVLPDEFERETESTYGFPSLSVAEARTKLVALGMIEKTLFGIEEE